MVGKYNFEFHFIFFQILVIVDWQSIMKIPTGDSSPRTEVKPTAAGIK